jgi:type IV pilus assembly protein PilA
VTSAPQRSRDAGFTLVELLVVMIVIGILAAIAIPVLVNQRAKAHDTATRTDVARLGRELTTYFIDGSGPVLLDSSSPGAIRVTDAAGYSEQIRLTRGTAAPGAGASANLTDPYGWCVALTSAQGLKKDFRFGAAGGLEEGTC